MFQPNLPGIEEYLNSPGKILDNPESIIKNLEQKGYEWLLDFNSKEFLISSQRSEPYIPYRIKTPSGKILDESEVLKQYEELENKGFSKEEIRSSKLLEMAINHDDTNKDIYKFGGRSFISKQDEEETRMKYLNKPFFG